MTYYDQFVEWLKGPYQKLGSLAPEPSFTGGNHSDNLKVFKKAGDMARAYAGRYEEENKGLKLDMEIHRNAMRTLVEKHANEIMELRVKILILENQKGKK